MYTDQYTDVFNFPQKIVCCSFYGGSSRVHRFQVYDVEGSYFIHPVVRLLVAILPPTGRVMEYISPTLNPSRHRKFRLTELPQGVRNAIRFECIHIENRSKIITIFQLITRNLIFLTTALLTECSEVIF